MRALVGLALVCLSAVGARHEPASASSPEGDSGTQCTLRYPAPLWQEIPTQFDSEISAPDRDLVRFVSSGAVFTAQRLTVHPHATPPESLQRHAAFPERTWFRFDVLVTRGWKGVQTGDTTAVWYQVGNFESDTQETWDRMAREIPYGVETLVYANLSDGHVQLHEVCRPETFIQYLFGTEGRRALGRTAAVAERLQAVRAPVEHDAFMDWLVAQQQSSVRHRIYVQTVDLSTGHVSPLADTAAVIPLIPEGIVDRLVEAGEVERGKSEDPWPRPVQIPDGLTTTVADRAAGQVWLDVPPGIYQVFLDGESLVLERDPESGRAMDGVASGGFARHWVAVLGGPQAIRLQRIWDEYHSF